MIDIRKLSSAQISNLAKKYCKTTIQIKNILSQPVPVLCEPDPDTHVTDAIYSKNHNYGPKSLEEIFEEIKSAYPHADYSSIRIIDIDEDRYIWFDIPMPKQDLERRKKRAKVDYNRKLAAFKKDNVIRDEAEKIIKENEIKTLQKQIAALEEQQNLLKSKQD